MVTYHGSKNYGNNAENFQSYQFEEKNPILVTNLKSVTGRLVMIKRQLKMQFMYRYVTNDQGIHNFFTYQYLNFY